MNYMSSYTLKHKRLSALLFSVNMGKYSISFSPVSWNISHICRVSSTFYIYFPSCISWRRLLVSTRIVLEDILVFISRRLRWEVITNDACVKWRLLRTIHIKQNSMILSCYKMFMSWCIFVYYQTIQYQDIIQLITCTCISCINGMPII